MARELPIFDPNPGHGTHATPGEISIALGRRPGRSRRGRHPAAAPPPGLDQGADAVGRELPRPQGPAARPQPQHGVRGGALPEHGRVLGAAHRDRDDPRRRLHPGVRLLRDQDRQAHVVRRRRAAPGGRGGRGHAPRPRRRHLGGTRRPARRRGRRLRRDHPRAPPPRAPDGRRGPHPGLQRRGGAAANGDGGRARHPQPQPGDRPPAAAAGAQAGPLGPDAGRPRAGEGVRGRVRARGAHEVEPDGRAGRDARRAHGVLRGAAGGRLRHPDDRPVPAADDGPPAARALLPPRRVRRDARGGARARASATSSPGRSSAPATTPATRSRAPSSRPCAGARRSTPRAASSRRPADGRREARDGGSILRGAQRRRPRAAGAAPRAARPGGARDRARRRLDGRGAPRPPRVLGPDGARALGARPPHRRRDADRPRPLGSPTS